jgi:hypothetical protein
MSVLQQVTLRARFSAYPRAAVSANELIWGSRHKPVAFGAKSSGIAWYRVVRESRYIGAIVCRRQRTLCGNAELILSFGRELHLNLWQKELQNVQHQHCYHKDCSADPLQTSRRRSTWKRFGQHPLLYYLQFAKHCSEPSTAPLPPPDVYIERC